MFTKILLASDGSEGALKAAQAAATLAKKFDAPLLILNVFPPLLMTFPSYAVDGMDMPVSLVEEGQQKVLAATGRVADNSGVPHTDRAEIGIPTETIVRIADDEAIDLIVVGCRGLSGLETLLLGSVSDAVAHHAHCPVLIVK